MQARRRVSYFEYSQASINNMVLNLKPFTTCDQMMETLMPVDRKPATIYHLSNRKRPGYYLQVADLAILLNKVLSSCIEPVLS